MKQQQQQQQQRHQHQQQTMTTTATTTTMMISRSTSIMAAAICLILLAYTSISIGQRATTSMKPQQQQQENHLRLDKNNDDNDSNNDKEYDKLLESVQNSNCTQRVVTTTSTTTTTTSTQHQPVWVPSFPGSGAELFRELVTTVTQQPTIDGALIGTCTSKYITCKTHWPTLNSTRRFQDPQQTQQYKQQQQRHDTHVRSKRMFQNNNNRNNNDNNSYNSNVIVLIRNPMHAIPSWYNQIYETRGHVGYHSKQAPIGNWKRYISKWNKVKEQLRLWKELIEYWLLHSNYHRHDDYDDYDYYQVRLWIPYEDITNVTKGPKLLKQVADLLLPPPPPPTHHDADHTTTTATNNRSTTVECLWKFCVQERKGMKRATHHYRPPYKAEHQQVFLDTIQETIDMVVQVVAEKQQQQQQQQNSSSPLDILLQALRRYQYEIQTDFLVFEDEEEEEDDKGKRLTE